MTVVAMLKAWLGWTLGFAVVFPILRGKIMPLKLKGDRARKETPLRNIVARWDRRTVFLPVPILQLRHAATTDVIGNYAGPEG